jgi:hypothetical protein
MKVLEEKKEVKLLEEKKRNLLLEKRERMEDRQNPFGFK